MAIARVKLPDGRIGRFEVADGTTPEEVEAFVSQQLQPQPMQMQPSHAPVETMENPEDTWRGTVSRFARPALEGGGAALGSLAGVGTGLATGPGAPVASPLLGVALGSVGYASGKRVADILDEGLGLRQPKGMADTALETVSDLGTGAALEMGGQILAPAFMAVKTGGKWAFQKIADPAKKAFTQQGAEQAAGQVLKANTSSGEIYAKNAAEADEIEKQIPGLKFTLGQRTGDPALIKLERSQMRGTGSGAAKNTEQIASNNEALRAYYQKQFPGKENVDELITNLQGQRQGLQQTAERARGNVQRQAGDLPATGPEQTGQDIFDTLKTGEGVAKGKVKDLYDQVPSAEIDVSDMIGEFSKISRPMSKFEDQGNIPDILSIVRRAFKPQKSGSGLVDQFGRELTPEALPKTLSLDDLQGLRSELREEASQIMASQTPNRRLASRYNQAADAVDKAINAAEDVDATGALRAANKFFRDDYAGVFRQGTVGKILRPGANRESSNIPLAQIPSKVWTTRNLSAADDFIKAAPNEATDIMRDHAAYDLLQSATDASGNIVTGKLNGWMVRNRQLLKKFGLENDFAGIANAQKAADAASKAAVNFERSVAARVLGADPEKAVASALSGRNAGKSAAQLMQMVGRDPAAKKGLQNAFAEHMMKKVGVVAKEMAGDPTVSSFRFKQIMGESAPVIRELYRNEPQKIKALNNMRRAYEVATRNTRSPIGGGSDTTENVLTELGKINVLSRTATIARGLFKIISKHGDDKANELLNRALFDPDYAQTLINAASGKIKEKELQTVIDGKIIQLDAYRKRKAAAAVTGTMGAVQGEE